MKEDKKTATAEAKEEVKTVVDFEPKPVEKILMNEVWYRCRSNNCGYVLTKQYKLTDSIPIVDIWCPKCKQRIQPQIHWYRD